LLFFVFYDVEEQLNLKKEKKRKKKREIDLLIKC